MLSMASLMRSAAEPWMTELMAMRWPALRWERTGLLSSGISLRRPRMVWT